MTAYYDTKKRRWRFNFWRNKIRYQGDCLDATGAMVTNQRAADQAEAVEKRKAELAPKVAAAGALTLAQCAAALVPTWERQASWSQKRARLREILAHFGPGRAVSSISQADVDDYVSFCLAQPIRTWRGGPNLSADDPANAHLWKDTGKTRGPAVANLYLDILRPLLVRATKVVDPITGRKALEIAPNVTQLKTPKRKARPVPDVVIDDVLDQAPAHLYDAALLMLCFGFRRAEVFGLMRAAIDWRARGLRLYHDAVKDAEDTFLPASDFAMSLLERLDAQAEERGVAHLVTWRPYRRDPAAQALEAWRPLKSPKRSWARIMKAVKKKHGQTWRLRDMRSSFITQVAIEVGPKAAQAMARHSDFDTTESYIEVADKIRRAAAEAATDRPSIRRVKSREQLRERKGRP